MNFFIAAVIGLMISLLAVSCASNAATMPAEATGLLEAYFCPADNCSQKLMELLQDKQDIKCAWYDINLPQLATLLSEKNAQVVMDAKNAKGIGLRRLRTNAGKQLMHNKFCILDGKTVITGSFNPTADSTVNNMVVIASSYLSKNYLDEFDELWGNNFGKGSRTRFPVMLLNNTRVENYFCPEDSCSEKVLSAISKAQSSIFFMTFSFTDENIAALLIEKANAIPVKGIFESSRLNMKFEQYKELRDAGIPVMPDDKKQIFHHKVFIIDNATVITGSYNPTKNADEHNDENILIIHSSSLAARYLAEFERWWDRFNEPGSKGKPSRTTH